MSDTSRSGCSCSLAVQAVIEVISSQDSKGGWDALLGHKQQRPKQPTVVKKPRVSSAGRRNATSAAAAPVDSKQRTLPGMLDITLASGRPPNVEHQKQLCDSLQKRVEEEGKQRDAGINSQENDLNLQLEGSVDVCDLADSSTSGDSTRSDSEIEEVQQGWPSPPLPQQQQQRLGRQQNLQVQQLLQPAAANPWTYASQPDPGLSHMQHSRRQIRAMIAQEVDGNAAPGAAAKAAAGEAGSSGGSSYQTAGESSPVGESQQVTGQQDTAGAGPQQWGTSSKQQMQEQPVLPSPPMAVGSFINEFRRQQQQEEAHNPVPSIVKLLGGYGSSGSGVNASSGPGDRAESAVTDNEGEPQIAAEVTSPAPQKKQTGAPKTRAAAAAATEIQQPADVPPFYPTPAAATAAAAERLSHLMSKPLALAREALGPAGPSVRSKRAAAAFAAASPLGPHPEVGPTQHRLNSKCPL